MRDNISSEDILNRKIIIELRFVPIPKFLDLKGSLISAIDNLKIMPNNHWALGDSAVKVSDSEKNIAERSRIHIEIDKLSYVSTNISSIDDYFHKFNKIYKAVEECLGTLDVMRIGCRIQGTYKIKSNDYSFILNNFKASFPSSAFIDDYPVNDLKLQLVYQNGMYQIGPIDVDDTFLKTQFPYEERNNGVGVGIDTDNYLIKTGTDNINDLKRIEDVFRASLSVEKSLLDNMSEF